MATLTLTYSDGTRCSKCGKICFESQGSAVRQGSNIKRRGMPKMSAYECPLGNWHLTTENK